MNLKPQTEEESVCGGLTRAHAVNITEDLHIVSAGGNREGQTCMMYEDGSLHCTRTDLSCVYIISSPSFHCRR
jgi:hypothetical protein